MEKKQRLIDANVKVTINASVLTGHTMRCENGVVKIFNRFGCLDCVFNLKDIPTVDAVEVVRCNDCRFIIDREDGTHGCYRHFMEDCQLDDFCSYGERK